MAGAGKQGVRLDPNTPAPTAPALAPPTSTSTSASTSTSTTPTSTAGRPRGPVLRWTPERRTALVKTAARLNGPTASDLVDELRALPEFEGDGDLLTTQKVTSAYEAAQEELKEHGVALPDLRTGREKFVDTDALVRELLGLGLGSSVGAGVGAGAGVDAEKGVEVGEGGTAVPDPALTQ
jgi:hypothetical protein